MDLGHFAVEDLHRCLEALRAVDAAALSSRAIAERVVSFLFNELRQSNGAPACPLVRLFRVLPSSSVADQLDEMPLTASDREAIRSGEPFDIVHRTIRPEELARVVHDHPPGGECKTGRRMIGTAQHIPDPRRIEERHRMLAEASTEMAGIVEYPQILDVVARAAIPLLGDG